MSETDGLWEALEDYPAEEDQGRGPEQADVTVENAECVRHTDKALLVRVNGKEHWMPQAAIGHGSQLFVSGDSGTLVVAGWFADEWERKVDGSAAAADSVAVENVACLSETRSGKAIIVRTKAGREIMIPVSQLVNGNEVRHEGDLGTLRVSSWIAREKGLA